MITKLKPQSVLIGIISLFVLLLNSPPQAYSHDNDIVHPDELSLPAKNLIEQKLGDSYFEIWQVEKYGGYFERDDNKDIRTGTIEEDFLANPLHHFYHPVTGKGLGIFSDAIKYGKPLWEDAIVQYGFGNKGDSYLSLGRYVHLLQDLSVPAHTHLDKHPPPFGDDYEKWCEGNAPSLPEGNEVKTVVNVEGLMKEMATLTYKYSRWSQA